MTPTAVQMKSLNRPILITALICTAVSIVLAINAQQSHIDKVELITRVSYALKIGEEVNKRKVLENELKQTKRQLETTKRKLKLIASALNT